MKQQFLPTIQIEKKLKEYRLSGMIQTLEMRLQQATEDKLGYTDLTSWIRYPKIIFFNPKAA